LPGSENLKAFSLKSHREANSSHFFAIPELGGELVVEIRDGEFKQRGAGRK